MRRTGYLALVVLLIIFALGVQSVDGTLVDGISDDNRAWVNGELGSNVGAPEGSPSSGWVPSIPAAKGGSAEIWPSLAYYDKNTIFLAYSKMVDSHYAIEVLKTYDGGSTWTNYGLINPPLADADLKYPSCEVFSDYYGNAMVGVAYQVEKSGLDSDIHHSFSSAMTSSASWVNEAISATSDSDVRPYLRYASGLGNSQRSLVLCFERIGAGPEGNDIMFTSKPMSVASATWTSMSIILGNGDGAVYSWPTLCHTKVIDGFYCFVSASQNDNIIVIRGLMSAGAMTWDALGTVVSTGANSHPSVFSNYNSQDEMVMVAYEHHASDSDHDIWYSYALTSSIGTWHTSIPLDGGVEYSAWPHVTGDGIRFFVGYVSGPSLSSAEVRYTQGVPLSWSSIVSVSDVPNSDRGYRPGICGRPAMAWGDYSEGSSAPDILYSAKGVAYTIGTSPSGLYYSVDGTSYSATHTFHWIRGSMSSHSLVTSASQGNYVFQYWSDGGGISHTIFVGEDDTTITGYFSSISPPSRPRNLQATAGVDEITLTWEPPYDSGGSPITKYEILRSSVPGGGILYDTINTATSYADDDVSRGQIYYYQLRAYNGHFWSDLSAEVDAQAPDLPSAPMNLSAIGTNEKVTLSWSAPTDDGGSAVMEYWIYRGTSPGELTFLDTAGDALHFIDADVINDVTYFYRASAVNAVGEGASSELASATPFAVTPSPPRNLMAVAGNAQVVLTWSTPEDDGGSSISNYRVYRGTTPADLSVLTTVGVSLTFADSGLMNGVDYYYSISAINSMGEGELSSTVLATPATTPGAPANLTSEGGDAQVTLTWSPPADDGGALITGYRIYRGTSPGGQSLLAAVGNSTTFIDRLAVNGIAYYYLVSAVNAIGEGMPSGEVWTIPGRPPSAPLDLVGSGSDSQVTLNWSPPEEDGGLPITNYRIYRGNSSGGETLLTILGPISSYVDTGLANGREYYYRVSAVNTMGEGVLSNEAAVRPATMPPSPRGLMATGGDGLVELIWSSPENDGGSPIINYMVYRGTTPGSETLLITLGNVLAYTDGPITMRQTYYYVVTAVNAAGEGTPSNEAMAAPRVVPSCPINLKAVVGDSSVLLSWTAPVDDGGSAIFSYTIYRGNESGIGTVIAVLGTEFEFADLNVTNGVSYYYSISAANQVGESARSTEIRATPLPLPGTPLLAEPDLVDGGVVLAWQEPPSHGGSQIVSYLVYRGADISTMEPLATIGNELTFTDSQASKGREYHYQVSAINSFGEGARSNEVQIMVPTTIPDVPADLEAARGDSRATLTWSPPRDDGGMTITGYKIYRGTSSGDEVLIVTLESSLSYVDVGLVNDQVYYYRVSAINSLGEGRQSDEVMVVPSESAGAGPSFSNYVPGRFATIASLAPQISVNYTDPDGIDIESVRIIVDGKDVTRYDEITTITRRGVKYAIPSILPLSPGNHTVIVTVADVLGNEASTGWTFTIDPAYGEDKGGIIDIASLIGSALIIIALIGVAFLVYIIYLKFIRKYTWRKYFAQNPIHKHYLIFYGPIIGAFVFLLIAFKLIADGAFASPWAYEYAFIVAFTIGVAPYAIGARLERRIVSKYEYAFSQFLFELADAIRGGIDPAKAIVEFSKVDTGVMRKHLAMAADGIRLGRPFEDMMIVMTKKMNSELISRYASLIGEASKLGGDISTVIHRAAKDMDDMIRIENERRRQISMQATTIYISFAVLVIVIYLLIDIYPSLGQLDLGLFGGSGLDQQGSELAPRMDYETIKRRFFHLTLIIAISSGCLIGLFSEGKLKFGLLHAIIMVAVATVFFTLMVF